MFGGRDICVVVNDAFESKNVSGPYGFFRNGGVPRSLPRITVIPVKHWTELPSLPDRLPAWPASTEVLFHSR